MRLSNSRRQRNTFPHLIAHFQNRRFYCSSIFRIDTQIKRVAENSAIRLIFVQNEMISSNFIHRSTYRIR